MILYNLPNHRSRFSQLVEHNRTLEVRGYKFGELLFVNRSWSGDIFAPTETDCSFPMWDAYRCNGSCTNVSTLVPCGPFEQFTTVGTLPVSGNGNGGTQNSGCKGDWTDRVEGGQTPSLMYYSTPVFFLLATGLLLAARLSYETDTRSQSSTTPVIRALVSLFLVDVFLTPYTVLSCPDFPDVVMGFAGGKFIKIFTTVFYVMVLLPLVLFFCECWNFSCNKDSSPADRAEYWQGGPARWCKCLVLYPLLLLVLYCTTWYFAVQMLVTSSYQAFTEMATASFFAVNSVVGTSPSYHPPQLHALTVIGYLKMIAVIIGGFADSHACRRKEIDPPNADAIAVSTVDSVNNPASATTDTSANSRTEI
jgi:hypothetical protein